MQKLTPFHDFFAFFFEKRAKKGSKSPGTGSKKGLLPADVVFYPYLIASPPSSPISPVRTPSKNQKNARFPNENPKTTSPPDAPDTKTRYIFSAFFVHFFRSDGEKQCFSSNSFDFARERIYII